VWLCHVDVAIAREHENRHCREALAAINAPLKASGEDRPEPGDETRPGSRKSSRSCWVSTGGSESC